MNVSRNCASEANANVHIKCCNKLVFSTHLFAHKMHTKPFLFQSVEIKSKKAAPNPKHFRFIRFVFFPSIEQKTLTRWLISLFGHKTFEMELHWKEALVMTRWSMHFAKNGQNGVNENGHLSTWMQSAWHMFGNTMRGWQPMCSNQ